MSRNEFSCDCNIIHKDVVEHVRKSLPQEDIFYHWLICLS